MNNNSIAGFCGSSFSLVIYDIAEPLDENVFLLFAAPHSIYRMIHTNAPHENNNTEPVSFRNADRKNIVLITALMALACLDT